MTERTVTHATFVIDRVYPVPPARVFRAWSEAAQKRKWFACHDEWEPLAYELDFRVGGREIAQTRPPGSVVHAYEAHYLDIVPDTRIVFAYDMLLGPTRISCSLATVELLAEGKGTRLRFTEQGAFLDGWNNVADREQGTRLGLDSLEKFLREAEALRSAS